jgi:hypothetical protein
MSNVFGALYSNPFHLLWSKMVVDFFLHLSVSGTASSGLFLAVVFGGPAGWGDVILMICSRLPSGKLT